MNLKALISPSRKKFLKQITLFGISGVLFIAIVTFFKRSSTIYDRNKNGWGNSSWETLVKSCKNSSATIRLYSGSTALAPSWFSVTAELSNDSEKQIYFSSQSLDIIDVVCSAEEIDIKFLGGDLKKYSVKSLQELQENPERPASYGH